MNDPALLDLRSIFGVQARVTTPSSTTGGEYVEMECTAEPGSGTMVHYHPEQEESFQVLEGGLEILRDGSWVAAPARSVSHGSERRCPRVAERERDSSALFEHPPSCGRVSRPDGNVGSPGKGGKGARDEESTFHHPHVDVRGTAPARCDGEAAAVGGELHGIPRATPRVLIGRVDASNRPPPRPDTPLHLDGGGAHAFVRAAAAAHGPSPVNARVIGLLLRPEP